AGGDIDEGTDLYAAGVILYELLLGRPPFDARDVVMLLRQQMLAPVPPLPPEIPADLCAVIERLLEKDRPCRFFDAQHAREALERCPVSEEVRVVSPASPAPMLQASGATREVATAPACSPAPTVGRRSSAAFRHIPASEAARPRVAPRSLGLRALEHAAFAGRPELALPSLEVHDAPAALHRVLDMHREAPETHRRGASRSSPILIMALLAIAVVSWGFVGWTDPVAPTAVAHTATPEI